VIEPAVEPINQEPVVVVIPAAEPVVVAAEVVTPVVEPVASPIVEPVQVAEVIEAAPAAITEALPVEIQESPKAEAPAPAPVVAEPVNLEATLAESGLVMVQTTSAAVAAAQPEPPVKLGRPRKAKPASKQAESESLVMVETAK